MASICRNPRQLLTRALYSTLSSAQNPSFTSFRAAKSAILIESDPEKVAQLFCSQSDEFACFRRQSPTYELSVRKLARSKRPDLIERIIDHQKPNSEGSWIRLIMLYSKSGMVDQAMSTFRQMKESSCVQTEKSICAILTVFIDNKMFDKVHELFKNVPSSINVNPGVKSHNLIVKAFVKEKKMDLAKAWIENMEKDYNVAPDINSYNLLLGAYLKEKSESDFDGVVKQIIGKGLEFNLTTYNYRISRFCENKECVRAKKLLDEMVSKGLKPNSAIYNTIIDGYCKIGDFESAQKVLARMLGDGYVLPCSFTYFTLIRHVVEEGEFDLALDMCKESLRRKWVPPFEAMAGLVKGLVERLKVREAREIVDNMKKRLRGPAVESWGKIEADLPL